ncbi:baculoviral IAP repeat-containing protein 3-like isoform X2 [Mytilus edulis]
MVVYVEPPVDNGDDRSHLPQASRSGIISSKDSDPIQLSSKVECVSPHKSELMESSEIHAKRTSLPCQQEEEINIMVMSLRYFKEQEDRSSRLQLQDKSKKSINTHKKRGSISVDEHKSLNDRISGFLFIITTILSIITHQWQSCLEKCKDHQRHTHICSRKRKNEHTSTCHSFCHDCGHNSSKSHLCKCKCCRDVIGELFNCLQKYLVFMHFTRRDFALLCGYVTCNAGQLLCVNNVPKPKRSLVRDLINGNNKNNDNCKDCQRKSPKISPIPLLVGQVKHTVNKYFLYFYFLSFVIKLFFISSILLVKVSYIQSLKNRNERRQKYTIYVSSLVLVLYSLNRGYLPERQNRKIKNKEKSSLLEKFEHDSRYRDWGKGQSTVIFSKDKLMDLIRELQMNYKSKNIKGFLYSIINHIGLARNIDILSYPVIRNDMTSELMRIASLHNFPYDNSPSLIRLAESGFYYEGKGREVICFSCSIKFDGWSHKSVPLEIHRQLSPNCAYLKEKFSTSQSAITVNQLEYSDAHMNAATAILNTEIIEEDSRRQCTDTASAAPVISSYSAPVASNGNNDSGVFGSSQPSQSTNSTDAANQFQYSHMVTSVFKDSGYASSGGNFLSNQSSSSYGPNLTRPQLPLASERPMSNQHNDVIPASRDSATPQNNRTNTIKEKYPEYIPIERRRATYKNWPQNLDFLHPLDLSECGFFYSNFGDCVRCFHCGIGLRNWESDDNPWVEHARWSRKCPYLLQRKGQEFIDSVLTVLGIQTDSEIEQQAASVASETTMQATSGFVSGSDVRDPIEHHAAQYIIREQIFGENKDRLVKKTMNQLLQNHDWEKITNDMLVNALLESKDNIETKTDPDDLSELTKSNDTSTTKTEQKLTTEAEDKQGSNEEDPGKIQKENEDLKDLYTCKICLDERVGITFVPCGHLVTCKTCSPKIRRCPLCRTFIRGTIKTTI